MLQIRGSVYHKWIILFAPNLHGQTFGQAKQKFKEQNIGILKKIAFILALLLQLDLQTFSDMF